MVCVVPGAAFVSFMPSFNPVQQLQIRGRKISADKLGIQSDLARQYHLPRVKYIGELGGGGNGGDDPNQVININYIIIILQIIFHIIQYYLYV